LDSQGFTLVVQKLGDSEASKALAQPLREEKRRSRLLGLYRFTLKFELEGKQFLSRGDVDKEV
jgi:hypothetical protein